MRIIGLNNKKILTLYYKETDKLTLLSKFVCFFDLIVRNRGPPVYSKFDFWVNRRFYYE